MIFCPMSRVPGLPSQISEPRTRSSWSFDAATASTLARSSVRIGELEGGSPRDRTTRAIVESLPIPVVAVPWYQIQHLPDALVLGHEVRHVVERDARVEEYVRHLMVDAVRGTDERYGTQNDWQRWSSEAFADIYRALCGGPAFVSALSDFLLVPAGRPAGGTGEYPPANIRLALVVAALRAAEIGVPEGSAEGGNVLQMIEERWLQEGVEIHQGDEVLAVATAIVGSRYRQFNNLRLADVVTFNGKQMRTTAHALLDGDPIGTRDVRTLIAAAAWAYANKPEIPRRRGAGPCAAASHSRCGARRQGGTCHAAMLNVTGRSKKTTYFAVRAKSCIIGPSVTAMSVARLTWPAASTTTCWTWSQAQK